MSKQYHCHVWDEPAIEGESGCAECPDCAAAVQSDIEAIAVLRNQALKNCPDPEMIELRQKHRRMLDDGEWSKELVDRGTKCFSPRNNGYPGGYPLGFLTWLQGKGWWGDVRLHLPCGLVADTYPGEVHRVDVKAPPITNATVVFDATVKENLPTAWEESFDFVAIDPPYSADLAESLYDTREVFGSIDKFVKCAAPAVRPGGLLLTLSYLPPKRPGTDFDLIACWGIYQAMSVSYMRCFQVWRRRGESNQRGLEHYFSNND